MVETWAWAFVLTVFIEVPIVAFFLRSLGVRRALSVGVLAQVLTHPALWFVMPRFEPYWAWLIVAESCVTVVEATLYAGVLHRLEQPFPLLRGLGVSLGANLVSTIIGLLL